MRTLLCCVALLLTLVPAASAHDDPPPGLSIDPDACTATLPLYDYASCLLAEYGPGPGPVPWYVSAYSEYIAHQVGCHVVGGPACVV